MTDHVTPDKRSDIMRMVRSTGSRPEVVVRKLIWSMGCRYRLNPSSLPGSPDIALTKCKKAVFVHGCFWHGHTNCPKARLPKSNVDYWRTKISGNMERDARKLRELKSLGWSVLVVWQCELRDQDKLVCRIKEFIGIS
ncbi:very short patch repair endonuclease [Burkholderia gladioli]|uniref:very short patch repair endonuclease n=1 Tax=Burkholderia gladioli TaxID=28095 RepID=UPI001C5D2EC2|nr:DNA mismatch endonuclease Vsr [Burkholderia gladioli]